MENPNKRIIKKADLLYPDLSYRIVGSAFDVYNQLGSGHHEKFYQRALFEAFNKNGLKFKDQIYYPLNYNSKVIGKNFFDFLVEDSIVVEIKKNDKFSKSNIDQVLNYLKTSNKKLAILINFGRSGVVFKRIVNFD